MVDFVTLYMYRMVLVRAVVGHATVTLVPNVGFALHLNDSMVAIKFSAKSGIEKFVGQQFANVLDSVLSAVSKILGHSGELSSLVSVSVAMYAEVSILASEKRPPHVKINWEGLGTC